MLIVVIYIIPEGRAAGSFRFLNLHHYMGITGSVEVTLNGFLEKKPKRLHKRLVWAQ